MHKVTINSSDLKAIAGKLSKIIQDNCITSIMESCLMDVNHGKARFIGLDPAYAIEATVPALYEEPFAVAIHFKEFNDAVKEVPDSVPVYFTIEKAAGDGAKVSITCGRDEFEMAGFKATVFPRLPQINDGSRVAMDQNMALDFSTSKKFLGPPSDVPSVQGTTVRFINGTARLYATDRGSMFRSSVYEAEGLSEMLIIMPPRTSDMLATLKGEGPISLEFSVDNWSSLSTENTKLYCRLIDDNPLPHDDVFAMPRPGAFKFNTAEMIGAIRVAAVGVNGVSDRILKLHIGGGKIIFEAASLEKSKRAKSEIDLVSFDESEFSISVQPDILMRCVQNLTGTATAKHNKDGNGHMVFSDEDSDAAYLIMPLRTPGVK